MSNRLDLNKERLIVSKAGFDASSPSLQEGDKLFDSTWLFSSTVVQAGVHRDAASYRNGKPPQNIIQVGVSTNVSTPQYIDFAPLPYVPTVLLIPLADSRYWDDYQALLLGVFPMFGWNDGGDYTRDGPITVSNSRITIPRRRSVKGGWWYREDFIYLIMAM